jgi:hypothetical protein
MQKSNSTSKFVTELTGKIDKSLTLGSKIKTREQGTLIQNSAGSSPKYSKER